MEPTVQRLLIWTGLDVWRAEAALVNLAASGLSARGTQLGVDPLPYRLDYVLEAPEDFVTRALHLDVAGDGWARSLRLTHDGEGSWSCESEARGAVRLPPPGGDVAALDGALDCDLGFSPLTNALPIRRHSLHERPETHEYLMAWVSVPDLGLHAYGQRYEHVRADADGTVVRFADLGLSPGFVAELELDRDGLVLVYPDLARRVAVSETS
jgi:hypothetical protein